MLLHFVDRRSFNTFVLCTAAQLVENARESIDVATNSCLRGRICRNTLAVDVPLLVRCGFEDPTPTQGLLPLPDIKI